MLIYTINLKLNYSCLCLESNGTHSDGAVYIFQPRYHTKFLLVGLEKKKKKKVNKFRVKSRRKLFGDMIWAWIQRYGNNIQFKIKINFETRLCKNFAINGVSITYNQDCKLM